MVFYLVTSYGNAIKHLLRRTLVLRQCYATKTIATVIPIPHAGCIELNAFYGWERNSKGLYAIDEQ